MEKQEQILNAALKLFVENGFHGTPTSKIAAAAGVSNGTLFHYYKTKDELVIALFVFIKSKLSACFETEKVEGETIKATFKRMYVSTLKWAIKNPEEFKFTQQFHTSPYEALLSNKEVQKQTRFFKELLDEAIAARVLKPLDSNLIFMLISSHINGIYEYLISAKSNQSNVDETVNLSFDLIWDMIS